MAKEFLNFLNGPLIFSTCIFGTILNIFALYLLVFSKIRRKNSRVEKIRLLSISIYTDQASSYMEKYDVNKVEKMQTKKVKKPRIFMYFLWIICCDIVLLFSSMLNFSIPTILNCFNGAYAITLPFWYTICNTTFTTSVWLMLALIVDRYCSLCRPLKSLVMVQHHRAKHIHITLSIVTVLSVIYSLPRYFELNVSYHPLSENYSIHYSNLMKCESYMIGYRIIGSLIFCTVLPYILVFIAFAKFWTVLRNASKARLMMRASKSEQVLMHDSDRLLLALTIRFLFSRFPTSLLDIVENSFGSTNFFNSSFTMFCAQMSNFFVILSSASTFFMFVIFSNKFRCNFYDLFDRVVHKNKQ